MGNVIKVGMADLKVCSAPDTLTTLGLGSCVGIALVDPVTKVGGLAHIMLPDSTKITNNQNRAKFADTGISDVLSLMMTNGAVKSRIVAKIAGGAQMFKLSSDTCDLMKVGMRNVESVKANLKKHGIRLLSEDTGLDYGRTIELDPQTGDLLVKVVGKPIKVI
ncbi:MAG: chemotaxis protein CheD [Lachnospiraceae bacterium]|nr:chemotaxis protein CheD [Lachnospira sp.]MBR6697372.1 chemotaxis protein CheD [Lachnospiraceae bacterium]